jgi:Asp-tRNA(Asn)/Glu-tRNA(Gln) amidotransferase A subunit family amidase
MDDRTLTLIEHHFGRLEPDLHAFVPEDGRFERLRREMAELEQRYPDPASRPRLFGALLGVKDIYHVAGFATRAGTTLPVEELRGEEGPVVRALRQAGMRVMGKTVTTEFAYFAPGPTRHPLSAALGEVRTPGGSSSGSAAAVAAGLCPLALGTQTIGSIIRPAAFCGVVGFKPSFGRVSIDGVIPLSPSADTVGWFATSVRDAATVAAHLFAEACDTAWTLPPAPEQQPRRDEPLVVGLPEGPYLERASVEALNHLSLACDRLREEGCVISPIPIMADFAGIDARHRLLVAAEAAETHARWFARYGDRYHPKTAELILRGQNVRPAERDAAIAGSLALRQALQTQMDAHGLDAWIAPAAVGPAPLTLESTGDPVMALPWHHAGLPAIALPAGTNDAGWPLGLQIIGRFGADEALLAVAARLEGALAGT